MTEEHVFNFEDIYTRMCAVSRSGSPVDLANNLEMRVSEISRARRESRIPLAWIIDLMEKFRASPKFLLLGEGSTFLPNPDDPAFQEKLREAVAILEHYAEKYNSPQASALSETERKLNMLRRREIYAPRDIRFDGN